MENSRKKEIILICLAAIGSDVAQKSNPCYWSCEDRGRAKTFEPMVGELRRAYSAIQSFEKPVNWLARLENLRRAIPTGIERNGLECLITFVKTGRMIPWMTVRVEWAIQRQQKIQMENPPSSAEWKSASEKIHHLTELLTGHKPQEARG